MLIDKPQIVEGSSIINATVPSGASFPASPNPGELFYLTTGNVGFYSYDGTGWNATAKAADLAAHLADDLRHLTAAQNIIVDGITVTAADINSIPALQTQANTSTSTLSSHISNTTLHITAAQNTFLDGLTLPTLTATHVNYLVGTTSNIQAQFNALASSGTSNSTDISTLRTDMTNADSALTTSLNNHVTDDTRHLTTAQNTFMDGISVSATEVNKLSGISTFLGTPTLASYLGTLSGAKLNINGTNAMTANFNAGGFRLTNVATPTSPNDAATKDYVDSFVQGLHWVGSARTATTANISLSGPQNIDGVFVAAGDRVLVKNQTTASENGIWIVAAGAWQRSTDYNTALEVNNSAVFVLNGSSQAKSTWVQIGTVSTIGVDAISFSAFSGPVVNSAGPGIELGTNGMVSVLQGEGITFSGNAVAVDLFTGGGLMTTVDGTSVSTAANAQLSLANIGTPGTYKSVTTDAKGRVTGGTNPTTLAGYGITDALAKNANGTLTGTFTVTGTVTAPTFVGALTGNASSASTVAWSGITGFPTTANWKTGNTLDAVKMLGWYKGGDGNVIFDASNATSPSGTAVNATNATTAWAVGSPTLMGWNGSGTYGVRVDSARVADNANTVGGFAASTTHAAANTLVLRDGSGYTNVNYINCNTGNNENPGISQVIVTNGTDNYYRKASVQHLANTTGPLTTSLGTIWTMSGTSPANGAMRLTPNFHLNSGQNNAVIVNWDNGYGGGNQAFRVGNGAGADAFYVTHDGYTWARGDITAYSDARVKKDVETISGAGAKVAAIRGVNFTRVHDNSRSTGVIAQEVQKVLPEAVVEGTDGMLSVKYGNMVGLLIEAIKELQEEVAALKAAK